MRSLRVRLQLENLEDRCVPTAGFFQGFETDTSGWVTPSPVGTGSITRFASGENGIIAQTGNFYAEVTGSPTGDYMIPTYSGATQWGGYTNAFPVGGYSTSIGIYLDMSVNAPNDTRFDFSSAINQPDGTHRRDFIFNAGFYNVDSVYGTGPRFMVSASNNSPGWPENPGRDPFAITATGWYTFQHRFYDAGGGVLACDLTVANTSGTVLHTWTLSDPTDIIGTTVGGNRYGWFCNNQFSFLAIDNSTEPGSGIQPRSSVGDIRAMENTNGSLASLLLRLDRVHLAAGQAVWPSNSALAGLGQEAAVLKHA